MNLRSVDLNLLTVFDAVISEGNISRAAEKTGISQPAMSAALSRLRITLNDELFVSTGRGVKPTPRALELEKPVRQILGMIKNTLMQSKEFDFRASDRTITLASMDYAGMLVAPTLLQYLQNVGASLTVNICSSNDSQLVDKMRFGSIDFNIDYLQIVEDDFHNVLMQTETACCLVNKQHSDIRGELTLEQYLNSKQIVLFPYQNRISMLDEFLKSKDIARKRTMAVASFLNYPFIVASTDFICTLPTRIGELYAKQYDLALYPLPIPEFVVNYYLMWFHGQDHDPAHRWVRETLLELMKTP